MKSPQIAALEKRIAELERQVQELQARPVYVPVYVPPPVIGPQPWGPPYKITCGNTTRGGG